MGKHGAVDVSAFRAAMESFGLEQDATEKMLAALKTPTQNGKEAVLKQTKFMSPPSPWDTIHHPLGDSSEGFSFVFLVFLAIFEIHLFTVHLH